MASSSKMHAINGTLNGLLNKSNNYNIESEFSFFDLHSLGAFACSFSLFVFLCHFLRCYSNWRHRFAFFSSSIGMNTVYAFHLTHDTSWKFYENMNVNGWAIVPQNPYMYSARTVVIYVTQNARGLPDANVDRADRYFSNLLNRINCHLMMEDLKKRRNSPWNLLFN